MRYIKRNLFVLVFLALFVVSEILLTHSSIIADSGLFWMNDFEITQKAHPEKEWDKVVFGTSELISGFSEELSTSGYINLGMDYGLITDLEELLKEGHIHVTGDLVLALGWGALYDGIGTNETYIWHKDWYEPYFYFERDRFGTLISEGFDRVLRGESFIANHFDNKKVTYSGRMTPEELGARMERLETLFWSNGIEAYSDNIAALGRVFDYCEKHDIRVRVMWLPITPAVEPNEVDLAIRDLTRSVCEERGVEFADWTWALDAECFYDTGHMNTETGMPRFTEVFDEWLKG